ncbi:hypothetical protein [Phocaeicola plebeius]|uniref:hypothetical protein n=1 Tax=Phocaeicola plebeius TaxID=310297 RepID=UPI003AB30493
MKKYLLGLLLLLVSCEIGKTYLYELNFTEDRDRKSGNIFNVFVHDKKGNAFDGTAWSSDGKTLSIEVNNGILVCLKMYYENGKIATYNTLQQHTFYDKDGNEINEADFRKEIDSETLSRMRMASMELEKR